MLHNRLLLVVMVLFGYVSEAVVALYTCCCLLHKPLAVRGVAISFSSPTSPGAAMKIQGLNKTAT